MESNAATVFILDDDRSFARAAADLITAHGMRPIVAHSIAESDGLLDGRDVDLMLLDHSLPDGTAFDFLDSVDVTLHGDVALVTGCPDIESATRAVASPIIDYVIKPIAPNRLETLLNRASQRAACRRPPTRGFEGMIGASAGIRELCRNIERVARTDASVLVYGESGTGKEVVAQTLHEHSERPGAFVAVNCGAIAPELLASQLFGHERGSFTGAHQRHVGFLEQADRGTLFLDEITEMPLPLQVYLLRVLETGRFSRVGGLGEIQTDARIVAATNREPLLAVQSGKLREDLYYRLADVQLQLPPLRKRERDAMLLASHFLEKLNERYGGNKRLAPDVARALAEHAWPGNVRELRSAVQRSYLMTQGDVLSILPSQSMAKVLEDSESTITFSVGMTFAEMEEQALHKTLAYHNNDKSATARALGVSVRTIHNHLGRLRNRRSDA